MGDKALCVLCAACGQLIANVVSEKLARANSHRLQQYDVDQFASAFACGRCPGLPGVLKWMEANLNPQHPFCIGSESAPSEDPSFRGHVINIISFFDPIAPELPRYAISPLRGLHGEDYGRRLYGRSWDSELINVGLLKNWLTTCDGEHRSRCRQPVTPRPDHSILLVDTQRFCLVDAYGSEEYAALSYVWGSIEILQNTKATQDTLREPGALDRDYTPPIPATVKDAILLAAAMGIRYLWIDCLCIVQDDDRVRDAHLNSMAAIYANACLTIIAAAGHDAHYGIPGVPGGSRKRDLPCGIIQSESGLKWVVGRNYPDWPNSCKWSTRGWTYQESVLSTRILILHGMASWHCSCSRWQEDMDTDEKNVAAGFRIATGPSCKPELQEYATKQPYTAWGSIVEQYNKRHLKYDWDVLAGIAGISNVMRAYLKDDFYFGLPSRSLEVGLLWRSSKGMSRRKAYTLGNKLNALPSWSWAGWEGDLHLGLHEGLWALFDQGRMRQVASASSEQDSGNNETPVSISTEACRTTDCAQDSSTTASNLCTGQERQCHHLLIATNTVTIQPGSGITFQKKVDGYDIWSGPTHAGYLYDPEELEDQNLILASSTVLAQGKVSTPMQLIALSTCSYDLSPSYYALLPEAQRETLEDPARDVKMCSVLWIGWHEGIAFRRALGFIYRDVWESWNPSSSTIIWVRRGIGWRFDGRSSFTYAEVHRQILTPDSFQRRVRNGRIHNSIMVLRGRENSLGLKRCQEVSV